MAAVTLTGAVWRWRALAALGAVVGAALPAGAARVGARRAERMLGARTAAAVAGYLATVTLPGERAYDPRSLLVAAFGIGTLPGWSARFEVYAARTPLLAGGGPALPTDAWQGIAAGDATARLAAGSLVPLKDPDQSDVVGGVWVADRPAPPGRGLVVTGALVLVSGLGAAWAIGRRRRMEAGLLVAFAAASVAHGVVAAGTVRRAAAWSTDRALMDTRLLLQDAPVRLEGPPSRVRLAAVARIVQGTGLTLSAGDSGAAGVQRVTEGDSTRAVTAVRLGPGRWAALRAGPLEATGGARAPFVVLALLGPAAVAVAWWGARTARAGPARHRRGARPDEGRAVPLD